MTEPHRTFDISKPIRFCIGWADDDSVLALRFAIIDALQGRETNQQNLPEKQLLCCGSVQRSEDEVRVRMLLFIDSERQIVDNAWTLTYNSKDHHFDVAVAVADAVSVYIKEISCK
ncbi:hypothetical protein [Methylobacterium sp. CM6246]